MFFVRVRVAWEYRKRWISDFVASSWIHVIVSNRSLSPSLYFIFKPIANFSLSKFRSIFACSLFVNDYNFTIINIDTNQ